MSEIPPPVMLDASGLKIAVIYATFNREISNGLLSGAVDWLEEAGATIATASVLGAFELPVVARHAADAGFDAVIAIGCVILGETDHYEHIAHRTSEGLMRVALDTGVPVAFGVLTTRDVSQARERSAPGPHNKGREAAAAAVQAVLAAREFGTIVD